MYSRNTLLASSTAKIANWLYIIHNNVNIKHTQRHVWIFGERHKYSYVDALSSLSTTAAGDAFKTNVQNYLTKLIARRKA